MTYSQFKNELKKLNYTVATMDDDATVTGNLKFGLLESLQTSRFYQVRVYNCDCEKFLADAKQFVNIKSYGGNQKHWFAFEVKK